MITHSPPRRVAALLTTLAVAAGALLLPTAAVAVDGAAPPSKEYRVLGGVHADTVSTFLDNGKLNLGSKADVDEGNGTRFAADDVWFHLEDTSQLTIPGGYDFIAPVGSTAWIAPESNPGPGKLWPGFNTESVAPGAIEGDKSTFTLTSFDGPGELEVFTGGSFGAPNRLWSSQDTSLRTFTIGRTHMHANWAFTAAGTYRLGVEGTVTVNGTLQTAAATYTFVVGDLPNSAATTTALSASATTLVSGDPLTLTATVTPVDAEGFVEFRNGTTVLGHEPVADGVATLTTTAPAVGTHSLTAGYVPTVANLAAPSTSNPATVTVTDGSGVEFGISGVAASYQVGDVLDARVVGHTLEEGQSYQWAWRPIGVESSYALTGTGGHEAEGLLTLPLDMSHTGYEINVALREDRTTITRSAWVPLVVTSDIAPVTGSFADTELFLGDEILFELDREPATGDTVRLGYRYTSGPWESFANQTEQIDSDTLRLHPTWALDGVTWVVQTLRDDRVVAQSEPFDKSILSREVLVQGLQGVYRVGQTLRATATVHPELDGLLYKWDLVRYTGGDPLVETITVNEGSDPSDLTVELPIEASHDGWTLAFSAIAPGSGSSQPVTVAYFTQVLNVSDSNPDTQLLFFEKLSEHYHQGYDVNLNLIADPALADGDSIGWEWKWPDTDEWVALPGASGMSHQIVAEQALDGVEVRAVLSFADGSDELIADPVTILVNDHGSPARQNVMVTGAGLSEGGLAVTEGDSVTVAAEVENGTVLNSFQWFLKLPGAADAVPIRGATAATYEFAAASEHDGAELSVAVVKPGGALAYGPSAPVTMTVTEGEEPISTTVTITGLEDSYEVGDTMSLAVSQDPDTGEDHWHWFLKPAGADEYTAISGELTASLNREVVAEDDGASIIARLYDHDHGMIAESAPVMVTVTDSGEPPVSTTVTIGGLEDSYRVGDTMVLTASQDPDTGENHWHWFIKPAGSDEYTVISGELTSALTREVAAEDDGASIIARLYDHDHAMLAESAPVTVTVASSGEPPTSTKPGQAPADRTAADLGDTSAGGIKLGSMTVTPGDLLVVDLGTEHADTWVAAWLFSTPTLLGGDWVQAGNSGSVTVQIPADAELGEHRLAVFAADGSLIGWADLTVAQAGEPGTGAGGDLAVTGGTVSLTGLAIATLLLLAGAVLVVMRRSRAATK